MTEPEPNPIAAPGRPAATADLDALTHAKIRDPPAALGRAFLQVGPGLSWPRRSSAPAS